MQPATGTTTPALTASEATITRYALSGSLNSLACWRRVSGGSAPYTTHARCLVSCGARKGVGAGEGVSLNGRMLGEGVSRHSQMLLCGRHNRCA